MQPVGFPTLVLNPTGAIVKHSRYLSLILNRGENENEILKTQKLEGGQRNHSWKARKSNTAREKHLLLTFRAMAKRTETK